MEDPTFVEKSRSVKASNATRLSRTVIGLMEQEKVEHLAERLALAETLEWMLSQEENRTWANVVLDWLALNETRNPQAVYDTLTEAPLYGAKTLADFGGEMISLMLDLIPLREVM